MYNASYHLIILIWLQVMYASTRGAMYRLGWHDNANPRIAIDELEKANKVPKKVIDKLRRRQAGHENGFEGLIMFVAAVVSLAPS